MKEITLYREDNGQYSTSEAKQDDVSGVYVQKEHLTDLQSQNDELLVNHLKAHSMNVRLCSSIAPLHLSIEDEEMSEKLRLETVKIIDEFRIDNLTKAQSLADIRAEAVIEAANAVVRHNECGFCLHCLLIDHANKIKGAE